MQNNFLNSCCFVFLMMLLLNFSLIVYLVKNVALPKSLILIRTIQLFVTCFRGVPPLPQQRQQSQNRLSGFGTDLCGALTCNSHILSLCRSDSLCILSLQKRGKWKILELYVFHVVSIALVVIWLEHLSPVDGQDLSGLLWAVPLLLCHSCATTCLIEKDIQSLTALLRNLMRHLLVDMQIMWRFLV